uniref:Uncharacterized protein n=1 Tax=Cacopsylla melanoneura TaxID=428564 RepID=A0A8D8VRS3_9HEMI
MFLALSPDPLPGDCLSLPSFLILLHFLPVFLSFSSSSSSSKANVSLTFALGVLFSLNLTAGYTVFTPDTVLTLMFCTLGVFSKWAGSMLAGLTDGRSLLLLVGV